MSPVSPKPCRSRTAGPAPPMRTYKAVPFVATICVRKPGGYGSTRAHASGAKRIPSRRTNNMRRMTAPNPVDDPRLSAESMPLQYGWLGENGVTSLSAKPNNAQARSRSGIRGDRGDRLDHRGGSASGAIQVGCQRETDRAGACARRQTGLAYLAAAVPD